MAVAEERKWRPARLIPVTGISGADEQERRGTSVLLAVLSSVTEFGRAITTRMGAPVGKIKTYIEVEFPLGDRKVRPDGLIEVSGRGRTWTALVEVKTGRNALQVPQVECYLDVARESGFDAVVTVSTELPDTPGGHPLIVDRRKMRKVALHHLSWSEIHTEALIERVNNAVSNPDQAWILSEFIRYLEEPKSGALEFEDMGAAWVSVREAAAKNTLRASDKGAVEVVGRFAQLVSYTGMHLAQKLGVEVRPAVTRRDRDQAATRLQSQVVDLANSGRLSGGLIVPNAIAPLSIEADLRSGRNACSIVVEAPRNPRAQTRVMWLLRQLQNAPADLILQAIPMRSRTGGPSHRLDKVTEDPLVLLEHPKVEIREFTLTLNRSGGTKRGQGRGSFIEGVVRLVEEFYERVVQELKPVVPTAPKVKPMADSDVQASEGPLLLRVDPADDRESAGSMEGDSDVFLDTNQSSSDATEGVDGPALLVEEDE